MISTIKVTSQLQKMQYDVSELDGEFIQAAAAAMSASEEVVGICTGKMSFGRACVLVTTKRVFLMRKGVWSHTLTQSHISLENVTAVECHASRKSGKLGIWNGQAYGEISSVAPEQCQALANALDLASRQYKEAMMLWNSGPVRPSAAQADRPAAA